MREALIRYAVFLAETATVVVAIVMAVAVVGALLTHQARAGRRHPMLELKSVNHRYEDLAHAARDQVLPPPQARAARKADRRQAKADQKADRRQAKADQKAHRQRAKADQKAARQQHRRARRPVEGGDHGAGARPQRPRVFVLDFHGDLRATGVTALREEITAVLMIATEQDEVVLRLENPGGTVHEQGFAASQLQRLTDHGIALTVAVDKVAASGGYLMACVARRILAAPFAVVGSIGVIDQLPNFHRLLDRHGIDYEMFKGGEQKRTVTLFGETSDEDRARRSQEVQEIHELFKTFVATHRPRLDVGTVATGRYWYGTRALELGLVDELTTSDDYLLTKRENADIYELRYTPVRSLRQRLTHRASALSDAAAQFTTGVVGALRA